MIKTSSQSKWFVLVLLNVALWCAFAFSQHTGAAPRGVTPANPVVQRNQIVAELQEIKALLQTQNALLRSGELKVVVEKP